MKYYTNSYYKYEWVIELYDECDTTIALYNNEHDFAEKQNISLASAKNLLARHCKRHSYYRWNKDYIKKLNCYMRLVRAY